MKPWLIGIGSTGALIAVLAGAYVAYQAIPEGAVARLNPLTDSHEAVIDELSQISDDVTTELESIQSPETRTTAMAKIAALTERVQELTRRAAKLGPVSDSRKNELTSKFESRRDSMKERLGNTAKRLTDQNLASEPFKDSMRNFGAAFSSTTSAIDIAWAELPEPKSEHERIDLERVEVRRDYWRALVAVNSEADYHALPKKVNSAADRVRGMLEEKKAAYEAEPKPRSSTSLGTKAGKISFDLSFQIADQQERLSSEFGPNEELSVALDGLREANEELAETDPNRVTAESMMAAAERRQGRMDQTRDATLQRHREMMDRMRNGGPDRAGNGPESPTGRDGIEPSRDNSLADREGPNSFGPMERQGPFPTGAAAGTESAQYEQNVQRFVSRNGPQNVVIIRTTNAAHLKTGELTRQLIGQLGTQAFFATRPADDVVMAIRYGGAIDDVAALIDWGKVVSTDQQTRLIRVECPQ